MSKTELLLERIGALSGIAFIVLFVAGFVMVDASNAPDPEASSGVIAMYLAENATGEDLSMGLSLASITCLLVFVSYLRHVLQRAESSRTYLPAVAWAGGLIFAATLLAQGSIQIASGVLSDYGGDTQVAKTLYVVAWDFMFVFGPPLAALIGATSVAGLLHGGLPRWLAWAGLPLVFMLLSPVAFFGVLLSLFWLAALSVTLALRTIRLPAAALVSRAA